MSTHQADVIIVGAGLAGSIAAYQLGLANLKVLVLEAGPAIPPNRTQFMETFYTSTLKTPESPYPPQHDALDPAQCLAAQRPASASVRMYRGQRVYA